MADGAASLPSTAGHGAKDLTNGLHDDLLREIIAHLPFTDAGRTAVLASRWRHLWRSSPLVIDDAHLPEPARAAAAVARFLANRPGPIRVVRLRHCGFASLDRELPEWPRLLAAKGIQEVALLNKPTQAQPKPALLPADILRCASLHCLSLAFWKFPVDLAGADIVLPHLRMLDLINVDISGLDLYALLASSPALQILTLARTFKRFWLRSQSLRCVVLGLSGVDHFAVANAPLLESLVLLDQPVAGYYGARINVACAPNLRVLGYVDLRVHQLQIRGNVIRSGTVARPSVVVPGLKILALRVNFRVLWEVKMLASFLRCFPNIDTLHIESALHASTACYGLTREQHAKLWHKEAGALECSGSHLKRMVFHKFRGHQTEFEFLKFIARVANEMESLLLVPLEEDSVSTLEVNEMIDRLGCPQFRAWASKVLLVSRKVDIARNLKKASDLAIDDPFCY